MPPTLITLPTRLICIGLLVSAALSGAAAQTEGAGDWRWSGVARVVVIPDVHGAYDALVDLLQATAVVDESLAWTGGDTHLVSLGDLLDRGAESRAVMDLLMRLQQEAPDTGGRVHVLMGNHEHMNLVGDLRYVAAAEYAAFAHEEPEGARDAARADFAAAHPELGADQLAAAFDKRYPPGFFGHRAAFRPDGRYGRWLLGLPTMIVINDTAFVHGGLPEATSDLSLAHLNRELSGDLAQYLDVWQRLVNAGAVPDDEALSAEALINDGVLEDPSRCIEERVLDCQAIQSNGDIADWIDDFTRLSAAPVNGYDSPFWYRGSVYCRDILERPVLDAYLEKLGVSRVVVGHTPTADARVRKIRDGKVIMADTGMLVSYYDGRPAALTIRDGETLVQYLAPAERLPPDMDGRLVAYGLDAAGLIDALSEGRITQVTRAASGFPWQVTLEHGERSVDASFYPEDGSNADKRELAAYRIDRLLGLELVAPTVARRIDDVEGTLQLNYPDTISERQRQAQGLGIGGWCPIDPQFQLMYMFDLLLANPARSADNLLYRRDSWTLFLAGHGEAFDKSRRLPAGLRDDAIRLPAGAAAALAALDQSELQAELNGLLDKTRMRAILARRDELLKRFAPR